MTTSIKQQAVKTIMSFLNKYIIGEKNSPFTTSMYGEREDFCTEQAQKLNEFYYRYLTNQEDQLCPTLINDIGQRYALRKGMRENTNIYDQLICPKEEDFQTLCQAAQELQLVSGNPNVELPAHPDFIIVPGALQSGTEKRLDTLLGYLKDHPDFRGRIFIFGTHDRLLLPFTMEGKEKESKTFEILAEQFTETQKKHVNADDMKERFYFGKTKLKETEIAKILSHSWKDITGLEWPTEYDMTKRLVQEKLVLSKNYSVDMVETFKKQSDPIYARATTQDEAYYVADEVAKMMRASKAKTACGLVVTNAAYQISTYQNKINQKTSNIQLAMLSPYKDMDDLQANYGTPAWRDGKTPEQLRDFCIREICDAFARWMYENRQCPLNTSFTAWKQRKANSLG